MNVMLRTAALAGLSLVLLSGCQTAKERANCPVATVLASAAWLTAFKPGMQNDPAGEQYTVQLLAVTESCDFDADEGTADSNLVITLRATRTPTGDAAHYPVPYFVSSVLDGSNIQTKKILATTFDFNPGEASTTFEVTVPSYRTKFDNGKKPFQYGLVVGLQLTREQLDYNKKLER
jgi:hypothetical protein